MSSALISLALRMGDNALILAQQNAKWCGHAPSLEEDIALANIALDLIGQARLWLNFAGEIEGKGRGEDEFAFLRDADEFFNAYLVEQKNGDYGRTIMRQYLFDLWHTQRISDLCNSKDQGVAQIAQKSKNEVEYHLRRSRDLVISLADGSEESIKRMQITLDYLWPSFGSLFEDCEEDQKLDRDGIAAKPSSLRSGVMGALQSDLVAGAVKLPETNYFHKGAARGIHGENLGHILSDMQFLQRAYPGAEW